MELNLPDHNNSLTTESFENQCNDFIEKKSVASEETNNCKSLNEDVQVKIRPMRLNRTEKKRIKYERKRENHKQRKAERKLRKKMNNEQQNEINLDVKKNEQNEPIEKKVKSTSHKYEGFISNRDLRKRNRERLKQVYEDSSKSLKVCIDCSFSSIMSHKEISRLAQQIGRCHASNKSLKSPVHLTLCNLDKNSEFYKELVRMNDGFENYIIDKTAKSIENYYENSIENLVYMSPDSENYIESLDVNKTYIIGGLVDETVSKKVTIGKTQKLKIKSYALPIEKYMQRKQLPDDEKNFKIYNYSKILAINQVFDILANYFIDENWPKALESGVPKRKGFCVKQESHDSGVTTSLA